MDKEILTIGVFAHANAGKTTITEHILYHTNIIKKVGRVDAGDTITDSMNIERTRGISVRDALVSFDLNGRKIQLIDTPGHVDFSAEVERAINVLDGAILVVSGVEGIEAQTNVIWKALRKKNVPTIFFVNKMDRMGADYFKTVKEIMIKLNAPIIPLVNVVNENDNLITSEVNLSELVESLCNFDEKALTYYVENASELTQDWVNDRIIELSKNGKLFPVIGGSALKDNGISLLLDKIDQYIPSFKRNLNKPFSSYVYAVRYENNVRKVYAKVLDGKIEKKSTISVDEALQEKVNGLAISNGFATETIDSVASGEIAIIEGISAKSGDIVGNQENKEQFLSFVKPLLNVTVIPKAKEDSIALLNSLKILSDEDPYLNARYDQETDNIYLSVMGEVQVEVVKALLAERFGIDADFLNPVVIHKEKPKTTGTGKASYTKASGIELEIEPLEPGSGIVLESKVSTDYLLKKYQNQAMRLIRSYLKQGLHGWEVTDIKITLTNGRFDSMGSSPLHFNIAVPIALMRALKDSDTTILEPIIQFNIFASVEYAQLIPQSLQSKNSIFEVVYQSLSEIEFSGKAPAKSMLNYSLELSKITKGMATYSSEVVEYRTSYNQDNDYPRIGPNPLNETKFVISDMGGSIDAFDTALIKKRKDTSSKFKRMQERKKQLEMFKEEIKKKTIMDDSARLKK